MHTVAIGSSSTLCRPNSQLSPMSHLHLRTSGPLSVVLERSAIKSPRHFAKLNDWLSSLRGFTRSLPVDSHRCAHRGEPYRETAYAAHIQHMLSLSSRAMTWRGFLLRHSGYHQLGLTMLGVGTLHITFFTGVYEPLRS